MGEGTTARTKRTSKVFGRRAHSTRHVVVPADGCSLPLAILLAAYLVAVPPLASSDPSDPTWLIGIYDEADGDTVVWLIERMELRIHPEAASEGKPDSGLSPPVRATEALRCPSDAPPAVISIVASPSRAPPLREGDVLVRSPSFHRLGTRKPVPALRPFDPSHVSTAERPAHASILVPHWPCWF